MTLTEFLLARIAEDEARARVASVIRGLHWKATQRMDDALTGEGWVKTPSYTTVSGDGGWSSHIMRTAQAADGVVGQHIAAFDPSRVLAECEAKRRIVEEFARLDGFELEMPRDIMFGGALEALRSTCMILASVYGDHADFQEKWRA